MAKLATPSVWYAHSLRERDGRFHTLFQIWRKVRSRIFRRWYDSYYLACAIWNEIRSLFSRIRLLRAKRLDLCGLPTYSGTFPNRHRSGSEFRLFRRLEDDRNFHISSLSAILSLASPVDDYCFLAGWDRGAEWGLREGVKYIEDLYNERMAATKNPLTASTRTLPASVYDTLKVFYSLAPASTSQTSGLASSGDCSASKTPASTNPSGLCSGDGKNQPRPA